MNKFLDQPSTFLSLKILETLRQKKAEGKPLYLQIKVLPKSPKNEIVDQLEDGTYKIRIAAPAMDGKANMQLIRFLKKSFSLKEVVIVSGQKDRLKLVKLMG